MWCILECHDMSTKVNVVINLSGVKLVKKSGMYSRGVRDTQIMCVGEREDVKQTVRGKKLSNCGGLPPWMPAKQNTVCLKA